ncbi:uncharacterized protein LOC129570769 [Sitodiplosis mosellana]|uniref:uncharacterized protein LOC129570769 n=1 Tax=Sitodiplosis mosellana TaxID=263140 RepID=UPI0024447200|nr:uncharacterized protein LOC129570769 [Sitodiplosis mosellana]
MQPEILKLTVDCFDELFDFLSLQDLCSIGETCKMMQKLVGKYFKKNFSATKKYTDNKGVVITYVDTMKSHRISAPVLNPFITSITHRTDKIQPLRYIDMHSDEFASLIEIQFMYIALNASKINCLQQILPKIEVLKLMHCSVEGDFYDILRLCNNLKEIHVEDEGNRPILNESANPWLLQQYPLLETLHLTQLNPFKINELSEFFVNNPNVRTFSTSSWCLARNGKEFIESNVKLMNLKVFEGYNGTPMNMQILCLLLNKLHDLGFYKHLHFKFSLLSQEHCDQMASLHALESLYVTLMMEPCDLSRLMSLKHLTLSDGIHMDTLAKSLVNLRRLSLYNAKYEDIVTFISLSVKIKEIEAHFKRGECIDLAKLNEQRNSLNDASKVMLFVQEDIFLKSKWTTKNGNLNLELVGMRRFES